MLSGGPYKVSASEALVNGGLQVKAPSVGGVLADGVGSWVDAEDNPLQLQGLADGPRRFCPVITGCYT